MANLYYIIKSTNLFLHQDKNLNLLVVKPLISINVWLDKS
jgi:hypothetical protein